MGPEINIDSILALEKQIEEGLGDAIQLKRARNSLLNISILVPAELLGRIFRWNVIPDYYRGNVQGGSYNFLLVCHHWFEVASGTPELWSYWGNTLGEWSRRCQHPGTAPLDLRLDSELYPRFRRGEARTVDGPLRDALRDRATRGSIRSIRISGENTDLLDSVISSLTPDGEDTRSSSIESLTLENTDLKISKFLSRHHFPMLRVLSLSMSTRIIPWDHLRIQATSLTTLSLGFRKARSCVTTSQLLSILALYPNLQDLSLRQAMIPEDVDDGPAFRVSLRRLKKLELGGNCHSHVFRLLERLEHPGKLESVNLFMLSCRRESVSESLEPYLRSHIQHDDRFQGRLGVHAWSTRADISLFVYVLDELNNPTMLPGRSNPSVSFAVAFADPLRRGEEGGKLCTNLITVIPREHVVHFEGDLSPRAMRDLFVTMQNIEYLSLDLSVLFKILRLDPLTDTKLLPSLRRLCLHCFDPQNGCDWGFLTAYLTRQTSGGQTISLWLSGKHPPIPPGVVKEIEGLVEEFIHQ